MAARKGKYSAVIDKLPKMPGVEPERRDVVEAVKEAILLPPMPDDPTGDPALCMEDADTAVKEMLALMKRAAAGRRHASEFARAYAALRAIRDQIDAWSRDVGLLLEAYQWLMVEQMEVEGVTSMKLSSGQPVSFYLEPYAQVVDKEAFRQWCIKQGLERQMVLPWQTTNSLTKNMLLAGDPEPDGVTCYAKTKVRLGSE